MAQNGDRLYDLIKTLTELAGPVGQEGIVLDAVESLWQAAGARTERTGIGNVLARVGGQGPKLMLAAHADELCYLVRAVDERGFLWLANGQAWLRTTNLRNAFAIGQRVRVLAPTGEIPGVIATVTGHMSTLVLKDLGELTWNDFWVDTGLSRAELAERGVTPGVRVIWDAVTTRFGPHVVGKALDDRALLAILTVLLEQISPEDLTWDLTLACTVQEEIGLVGASALAARERFDAAIALDVGLTGDTPLVDGQAMPVKLGAGPILVHKDSRVHYDYKLTQRLGQTARDAGIPIQHAVFGSFGSDGGSFMQADIPAALLAFPTRYTHSPFETGHMADIQALVEWLAAFVTSAPD